MNIYIVTIEALYNNKLDVIEIKADKVRVIKDSLVFYEFSAEEVDLFDITNIYAPGVWKQCVKREG